MGLLSDAIKGLAIPPSPKTAHELVGQFIHEWSWVEYEITRGLLRLTGIDGLEASILFANMTVRDKIFALKTLLNVYAPSQEAREATDALMTKAGKMNESRNTVVHNLFWRTKEDDGVEFSVTKAKGRLHFPKVIWKDGDFAAKMAAMRAMKSDIKAAVNRAASFRRRANAELNRPPNYFAMAALSLSSDSTPSTGEPDLPSVLRLPRQDSQSSPPASPEKGAQTPEAPPPKRRGQKRRPVGSNP